jgi:hypothetical protein
VDAGQLTQPLDSELYNRLYAVAASLDREHYIDIYRYRYARLTESGGLVISEAVHFVDNKRFRRELQELHPDERIFELQSARSAIVPLAELVRESGDWVPYERLVIPRPKTRVRVSALGD